MEKKKDQTLYKITRLSTLPNIKKVIPVNIFKSANGKFNTIVLLVLCGFIPILNRA